MPIYNHTFADFHKREKDIEDAKKLLLKNGYRIEKIKDETRSQIYSS